MTPTTIQHRPENAASPSSPDVLIPSLPNDVALNILARVPRQFHPVLSAVSKSIRAAISSSQFFDLRSFLNCTETLFYVRLPSESSSAGWFAAHGRTPHLNPSNEQKCPLILAPLPPIPGDNGLHFSVYAVVGPKIYVLGGKTAPNVASSDVWVLDCRFHTWERGPSTLLPRCFRGTRTAVLDGKIYVMGVVPEDCNGCSVEVLDPVIGRWQAVPCPLDQSRGEVAVHECIVMGGRIRVFVSGNRELNLDPRTQTWEVIEWSDNHELELVRMRWFMEWSFYLSDWQRRTFGWFDKLVNGKYSREQLVEGAVRGPPKHSGFSKMVDLGDARSVIMIGNGYCTGKMVERWCAENRALKRLHLDYGQVAWWEIVFSQSQSNIIRVFGDTLCLGDCYCFAVSF